MTIKEEFQIKMEEQKEVLENKINELKAKADKADAEVKIKYYKEIEVLRTKRDAAWKKSEELRNAGEGAGESIQVGVEKAWADLVMAID